MTNKKSKVETTITQIFRTAYEPHKKYVFKTRGESLTQQHFKEECDVINIIKKHDRNGIIEHVQRGQARYAQGLHHSGHRPDPPRGTFQG